MMVNIQNLEVEPFFSEPDRLPVRVLRFDKHYSGNWHRHEFDEVVVVTRGKAVHSCGDASWPVVAGDVFVIKGDQEHRYSEAEEFGLVNILYLPCIFEESLPELNTIPGFHALFTLEPDYRRQHKFKSRLKLNTSQLAHVESILGRMEKEEVNAAEGYQLINKLCFLDLVVYLSRCYADVTDRDSEALLQIAGILTYVENHFTEQIAVEELAEMVHMSRSTLFRVFKRATGLSPLEYQLKLRIRKACHLLNNSPQSVSEIAYKVGFKDSNYFCRQFRQVMDMSPSQYRKKQI